jgi:hypothetical protein
MYILSSVQQVVIITSINSPRLSYICEVIFKHYLDISYQIGGTAYADGDILINYGSIVTTDPSISISANSLLSQIGLERVTFDTGIHQDLPYLFKAPNNDDFDLPFDLFSMCFYLLTRYEEYYASDLDVHQRYQSKNSIAVKQAFIDLPIIDLWIQRLATLINSRYGTSIGLSGKYHNQLTIDIDLPYAFKYKGWKAVAGFARDLIRWDKDTLSHRFRYFTNGSDPFDTYQELQSLSKRLRLKPIVFILNRYKLPHDENHLANTDTLKDLIRDIAEWADIGIHPSMHSNNVPQLISEEMAFVQEASGRTIKKSRQHFLKVKTPHTYSALVSCDITDDYTMGYPDVMGFRASTARSYRWYDLLSESPVDLMIHPFVSMDVTMRKYQHLSPDKAIHAMQKIKDRIKSVNGTCSIIWHNSSLSKAYGWKGWREVLEVLVTDD